VSGNEGKLVDKMLTRPAAAPPTADIHAPLVTVVIVNHNYSEFVGQCIRSVDQQDYPNIQCIVLDCASKDDSLSVIHEALGRAKNPFFEFIRLEDNHGHLINALSVLEHIKGAFLTYLDADDFLFPEFVSTHVRAHLNDLNSASISVTDQIQVDATGQILAGTCHWHQKWRAFEPGTAWTELTSARSCAPDSPHRLARMDHFRLYYVPAWWSSWVMERWIWSATSGMMFRKAVVESLAPSMEDAANLRLDVGVDGYFGRFGHSVGGTLVVDGAQGAYRRHGKNLWSSNRILGGQTSNGSRNLIARFRESQRIACHVLVKKHQDCLRLFGGELYYSIAWQLMSNEDFHRFVKSHEEDRATWEKTIRIAGAAHP
jgi:glycosyltransferase involved in cell wall biosynthesis